MRSFSMKTLAAAAALAALVALPAAADAQLTGVSPNCDWIVTNPGTGTYPGFSPTPAACSGAWAGNDKLQLESVVAQINADWKLSWTWSSSNPGNYLGSTDAGKTDGPFSSVPDTEDGYVQFDSPFTGTFVLILKSANQFSMYLFKNQVNLAGVTYVMDGTALNPSDDPKGLSHASLWGGPSVPEPSSMLLMGAGLLGLGFLGYRRRDEQA